MTNDDLKKIKEQAEEWIPCGPLQILHRDNVLLLLDEVRRLNSIIDKYEQFEEKVMQHLEKVIDHLPKEESEK